MKFPVLPALLLAIAATTSTNAQVVVLVDANSGGCIVKYNRDKPYATASNEARNRWGNEGNKILATSRGGYGAIFGATDPRNRKTRFFVSHGRGSSEEAINGAKVQAADYIRNLGVSSTSFICGSWNNRNDYALDTYPSHGEF